MTTALERFFRSKPKNDENTPFIALMVSAGLFGAIYVWTENQVDKLHTDTVIKEALYGKSLDAYLKALDTDPRTKVQSLEINKAADRFMADITTAALGALDVSGDAVTLPSAAEIAARHLTADRYGPVGKVEISLPSWGKQAIAVRTYGPQAVEKLSAVKEAITRFDAMTATIKSGDLEGTEMAVSELRHSLDDYIATFHTKTDDVDRSSADLRGIDQHLDALERHFGSAALSAASPRP